MCSKSAARLALIRNKAKNVRHELRDTFAATFLVLIERAASED